MEEMNKKFTEFILKVLDMVDGNYMPSLKLLTVSSELKIPEKLFKHSGYKSVEPMMERLEQMGVIVAAVPESINLYEISESDLNNIELIKVSDLERHSTPFFDDFPPQPNK